MQQLHAEECSAHALSPSSGDVAASRPTYSQCHLPPTCDEIFSAYICVCCADLILISCNHGVCHWAHVKIEDALRVQLHKLHAANTIADCTGACLCTQDILCSHALTAQ